MYDSGLDYTKGDRRFWARRWVEMTKVRANSAGWRFTDTEILKP
jgi:hypothetical protein